MRRIEEVARPAAHVAQVVLVITAILGYIFTVRPVYQFQRIQERAASYQSRILDLTAEIEKTQVELIDLEGEAKRARQLSQDVHNELNRVQLEFGGLSEQRDQIQSELASALADKTKVEEQIKFMRFNYVLDDGTPADTTDKVEQAKDERLQKSHESRAQAKRSNFFFVLERFGAHFTTLLTGSEFDVDSSIETYPFLMEEFRLWKEHGAEYPRFVAVNTLENADDEGRIETDVGTMTIGRIKGETSQEELEKWKDEARQRVDTNYVVWVPPHDPSELTVQYSAAVKSIEERKLLELESVEKEYGDWVNVRDEQRRIVFEHNYKVGRENARRTALGESFVVESDFRDKANEVRKSVSDEVLRLLSDPDAE